ncbi:MAG: hypothetical protein U1E65_24200 [Myxococcota bacterium]
MLCGATAEAQLGNPLDSKPRPNLIVAFDTSITMGITSDCSHCHEQSWGYTSRLQDAKVEILNTLPIFKDLFVFGGVQYEGCGSAHVKNFVIPNMGNLPGSYAAVTGMIAGAVECSNPGRGGEKYLPTGSVNNCLTPTPACSGDPAVVSGIVDGSANVPGLTLPSLPATTTICSTPARLGQVFDPTVAIATAIGPAFSWPRWDPASLTPAEVDTTLCQPLLTAINALKADLTSCSLHPSLYWDLSTFVGSGPGTWCNTSAIAGSGCTPASAFDGTCTCDDTNPWCVMGGLAMSECGHPLDWKARQQIGVCASYADTWGGSPALGDFFLSQPDNVRNGKCRENVAVFFTDGAYGSTWGTAVEASAALAQTYNSSFAGQSNMFVFHASTQFTGEANAMALAMNNPRYDATNQTEMLDSFSRIVNRVYHGDYTGANMTVDTYGTRAVVHEFKVPSGGGNTGERYLGRPSKLVVLPIDLAGVVGTTPIFETDWASKAGWPPLNAGGNRMLCAASAPTPGSPRVGPGTGCVMTALEQNTFGPPTGGPNGNVFRNGILRDQTLTIDGQSRQWGYMLGGSTTQPVIVDAPGDVPQGAALDVSWQNFVNTAAIKNRPRVIYTMSAGFLHAIHGGVRVNGAPTIAVPGVKTLLRYAYNDDPVANPSVGKEMFRYFVRSYNTVTDWQLNDVVPRPVTAGQLVAKEMHISNTGVPTARFATVLALAQGKDGRGFATLNVSDPTQPRLMAEWVLPVGSTASNEPMMYQFPPTAGMPLPVVVVTSGYNDTAAPALYAFDIRDGSVATQIALPAGEAYPTEPVCLDATGANAITHCYVLSQAGHLIRVTVDSSGAFSSATSVFDASGAGRVFLTRPVGFFGPDGAVNLAFGSGLSTDLTAADSASNALYKVVDNSNRKAAGGTVTNAGVCHVGGAVTNGILNIGTERIVSPPVVSKGVVAFTTYTAGGDGCVSGTAKLYAMDFEKCTDAFDATRTAAPIARAMPDGVPGSPVILRQKSAILTQSSDIPAGNAGIASPGSLGNVMSRGRDKTPFRALYWRKATNAR